MRRTLLRSPAFAHDLRRWLKSHPDTAASVESTLEQLSADAAHPSLRPAEIPQGHEQVVGLRAQVTKYKWRLSTRNTMEQRHLAFWLSASRSTLLKPSRNNPFLAAWPFQYLWSFTITVSPM